jgi:hypothetical protein
LGKGTEPDKNEFTEVSLGPQFMKIRTSGKEIEIHRSLFEDYFAHASKELQKIRLDLLGNI